MSSGSGATIRKSGTLVGVLLLLSVLALLAGRLNTPLPVFLPAILFLVPLLGFRLLDRPVIVVGAFLLVAVDLGIFQVGDAGLSVHVVVAAALMWALGFRLVLRGEYPFGSGVERAYLVFLAVTAVSVAVSVNVSASVVNWTRDVEYLLLFAFVSREIRSFRDRRILLGSIVAASAITCVVGLIGIGFGVHELYGLDTPLVGGGVVRRVSSTLSHPVSFSLFLAVTGTLTLSLLMDGRWFRRAYLLPVFVLQIVLLYLTFGRTGWVAFLVSVVVLLLVSGHRRWVWAGVPAAMAAAAAFLPSFLARWETALATSADNSFLWRIGLYAYSISLIPAKPLFGSGPGTFVEYVAYGPGKPSHETWLGLAVESGLVSVVAFLILTVTVVFGLLRRHLRMSWRTDPIPRAVVALFLGILVASLVENPFEVPEIATYVWVLLALVLSWRDEAGNSGFREG